MTRQRLFFLLQIVITLILLVLLFRRLDFAALRAVALQLTPTFYAGSLAAVLAGQLIYAWRWQVVLASMGRVVPYRRILAQYLMGMFFGNLMPSAVGGDAAKVYYLGREEGYVEVGASVFVDRLLGFFFLTLLGAALAWTLDASAPIFALNRRLLTALAAAFLLLFVGAWLLPEGWPSTQIAGSTRVARFAAAVSGILLNIRRAVSHPTTLAAAAAVVVVYSLLMSLVYRRYFALTGAVVPGVLPVLSVLVSMSIFVNVPISVNGIGLREQLHALLFAALGLPKEVSVGISLLVFSHFLVLSLVGYGVWLRAKVTA
jgi:uncharacterized protein (TIRG00374 family)